MGDDADGVGDALQAGVGRSLPGSGEAVLLGRRLLLLAASITLTALQLASSPINSSLPLARPALLSRLLGPSFPFLFDPAFIVACWASAPAYI